MQDMSFSRVQFFFFFRGACPRTPYIIRAFGANSTLVSPVTLMLNVQLEKTPYLDTMNDDTEKQWSKIYILCNSGWKQRFEHQRNCTKQDSSCSKTCNKKVQLVFRCCCKPSWIAMLRVLQPMFDPVLQEIRLHVLFSGVVKRAPSLFNSFYSHVAKQIARFLLPILSYLK